jgi:hypothetical protein
VTLRFLPGLLLLLALPVFGWLLGSRLRARRRTVAVYPILEDLVDRLPLLPRSYLLRRRLQVAFLLAAVACAALAAGDPVLGNAEDPPRRLILVVDDLVPRQAQRGGASPWEETRKTAARLARGLRADDRVLVVRAGGTLAGEGPLRPAAAGRVLAKLPASALPVDRPAALELAAVLQRADTTAAEIVVVTAAPAPWEALLAGRGPGWRVAAVPAGGGGPNRALLDVEVRPDLFRAGRLTLFCRAGSFGPAGAEETLTLTVRRDEAVLARRELRVRPGESRAAVFPDIDAGAGLLRVELAPDDAFPDDNLFLAPLPEKPAVAALLVTEENPALEAALRVLPGLSLTVRRPADRPAPADAAVVVWDAVTPPDLAGNVLLVAPPEGVPGISYRGDLSTPRLVRADATHPLLEGVSFTGLQQGRMPLYALPSWMESLATADGAPLLAIGRSPAGGRVALLSLAPGETAWAYDPSFPILVANLVAWLAESPLGVRSSFLVGDRLPPALGRTTRSIVGPDGVRHRPPGGAWDGFRFALPGRYRIAGTGGGPSGEVFVNLLDASVSATLGTEPAARAAAPAAAGVRPFRREAQGALAILAIVLLTLERAVAPRLRAGRVS